MNAEPEKTRIIGVIQHQLWGELCRSISAGILSDASLETTPLTTYTDPILSEIQRTR